MCRKHDRAVAALRALIAAVDRATDGGSIDHLDCFDDGGTFFYDALDEARKAAE